MFISIILGLGLASLFRKVCHDKDCIKFNGPIIEDVNDRIFQYGEDCYKYKQSAVSCDKTKKIIDLSSKDDKEEGLINPILNIPEPVKKEDGGSAKNANFGDGSIFSFLNGRGI